MKRKLAIILLTLSCLQLIGCGKANNIERVEINTEVQNEIDEDKQKEQETIFLDGSDQIALIAENKDDWFVEDEWNFYVYTVADLDLNGRLEVICTSTQGTGLYSYTNYFEVNEDGTALEEWNVQREEGMSEPDIGYSNFPVFYQSESDTYTYIVSDYWRMDAAHSGGIIYGVTYENGEIEETELGRETYAYDETTQIEELKYYNVQGEEITEAEYKVLPQTIYQGCDEKVASFQWITGEDLDIPDMETALGVLYQGFFIE